MRYLLFIFLSVLLFSCKKNENKYAKVDFNYQSNAGTTPYLFSDYFTNGDGIKIRLELLKFYISNVTFYTEKNKSFEATEIALVEINNNGQGSLSCSLPSGNYTKLSFGIGVPEYLNESDPADYADDQYHPLNTLQNTYWGMNSMYRFVMIDGKYDIDGDGTDEGAFSYHTGYSDSYRTVSIEKEFDFEKKESYTYQFSIDVTKLFYVSGSQVDVTTESNYHGDYSLINLSIRISDNFMNAISMQ